MLFSQRYKTGSLEAIEMIDVEQVQRAIELLAAAREEGRHIYVCGNGGSANAASHFVTEMVKGASFGRSARFRILSLTDSAGTLTAYSNDVSYECVFVEQLKNFAQPGDVVIAISGSGNSPNVVHALEYANSIACRTVAFTGRDGGRLAPLAELKIHIPHPHMGCIEQAHMVALHMIAYYFMDEESTYR